MIILIIDIGLISIDIRKILNYNRHIGIMKGSLHMKKLVGISIVSTMLILGQPFISLADTSGLRTLNFRDIEGIITEQNLEVRINENERLKTYADFSALKRDIKELEDELEDINDKRDRLSGTPEATIGLGAEKRALLDALKQLERNQVDRPTFEAIADINASINNDSQIRLAEGKFIGYNQSKLGSSDISMRIETVEDQLATMQLQESLGMVSRNSMNDLKTSLVNMQTNLESIEFQQDSFERQLKNLLNDDQENTLVIEGIPYANEDFIIEDKDADLEKAQENSYTLKLMEQQIVISQAALERAKKDHGMSSNDYKQANFELTNANLKHTQQKDTLKLNYYTMVDDIVKMQSDIRLAEQNLEDKKVALSEAQVRMGLGMISQLDLDEAITAYQLQEIALKSKQIELFNAKCNYEWFLKGMS